MLLDLVHHESHESQADSEEDVSDPLRSALCCVCIALAVISVLPNPGLVGSEVEGFLGLVVSILTGVGLQRKPGVHFYMSFSHIFAIIYNIITLP